MSFDLTTKIPTTNTAAFMMGVLSVLPYLFPAIVSLRENPTLDLYNYIDLQTRLLYLPISFGILSIILCGTMNTLFTYQMRTYWILGFLIGLIYSFIDMYDNYYTNAYGLNSYWTLFIMNMVIYMFFYGVILNFMFSNVK